MADWPATLVMRRDGYKEAPPNNVMRSAMDTGPDKIRRRSTAAVRPVSFDLILTDVQVDTLDVFYTDDTMSGSLAFNFPDVRSGNIVQARFTAPPEYSSNETMWNASVSLEILP